MKQMLEQQIDEFEKRIEASYKDAQDKVATIRRKYGELIDKETQAVGDAHKATAAELEEAVKGMRKMVAVYDRHAPALDKVSFVQEALLASGAPAQPKKG
jgi:ElaB/YqjD/DUF883 family membrane-anchored ribosome-binding protein